MAVGGKRPEKIKAQGFKNENGVDVSVVANLTFPDGATANVNFSGLFKGKNEATIYGESGLMKVGMFVFYHNSQAHSLL